MKKAEKKKRFEVAIIENLENYKSGKLFVGQFENPICKLTTNNGHQNCYRCPLNVTAQQGYEDYGCLSRRTSEMSTDVNPEPHHINKAIKFNETLLDLMRNGVNPYDSDSFHSKSKGIWAYSLRAIDIALS